MAVAGVFLRLSVCVSVLCVCRGLTVGPAPRPVVLVVIDVQNCFVPGGENPVPGGAEVIPVINGLRSRYGADFDLVVMSQDWHCADHVSFASQHPGYSDFDVMQLDYDSQGALCTGPSPYAVNCTDGIAHALNQTLWPDHCVINTTVLYNSLCNVPSRCGVPPQLTTEPGDLVVRKGYRCEVDSYSAFYDNGGFRQTELDGLLRARGVRGLVITGLALFTSLYSCIIPVDSYSAFYDNGGFRQTELDALLRARGVRGLVITGLALFTSLYSCIIPVDSYSAFYDNGGFRQTELDGLLRARGVRGLVITGLALFTSLYSCIIPVDSYSAFYDNGGFRQTELDGLLRARGVRSLVITGLALDFCVAYTALDGQRLGYDTYVVQDAARGITQAGVDRALADMQAAGVTVVQAGDVGGVLGVAGGSGRPGGTVPGVGVVLASLIAVLFRGWC
ncbi:hypothetical protein Bbelb_328070 [Branchiostoma belcheri]|nr:hypothetical protein Bbelb_328070 [Branchiostoma belcheri]